MTRKTPAQGYQEARLLAVMAEEGCPICHDTAGSDDRFFFWFFTENYYETFTLDALTRSLGFCLAHGEHLVRTTLGAYQLAAVHEVLVRRVRRTLSDLPLAVSDLCPACRDKQELVERSAFVLGNMLRDSGGLDRYGHPGVLCFPHLRAVAGRAPFLTLESLLALHEARIRSAIALLEELTAELVRVPSDGRQDVAKALVPALRLAVGHDLGDLTSPPLAKPGPSRRLADPVARFEDWLRRGDACPVCLEVCRAWIEWIGWLDDQAPKPGALEDLLPTCPTHVWSAVHLGGAFLATATTRHALGLVLGELATAAGLLRPPTPPEHERILDRLKRAARGPHYRLRAARQVLGRALRCPACERLDVARDRALSLLLALLEDRQHRARIEGGYGLCLKHFRQALALNPAPGLRAMLVEIEQGKLARLGWELEESLRKVAWGARPEAKGTEEEAWRRATLRFSGSFGEEA